MSEHDEKAEERVEDLDVPESESEEVKGGLNFANKFDAKFGKIKGEFSHKIDPGSLGSFGDGSV